MAKHLTPESERPGAHDMAGLHMSGEGGLSCPFRSPPLGEPEANIFDAPRPGGYIGYPAMKSAKPGSCRLDGIAKDDAKPLPTS